MSTGSQTMSERLVTKLSSGLFGKRASRRSFLAASAVVGSAIAIDPWTFLTKPVTAYATVCGAGAACSDGWSVFCCTINNGANTCPPGSFIGGWWKADRSSFCCGSARYYIDCNAKCGSTWRCHCNSASCDQRRVACNQFRYGQCNQGISCYGPVVCRMVTCAPPWQLGMPCTSTSATDNATLTHSAPCLPGNCPSAITRYYYDRGGPGSVLGRPTSPESTLRDGRTHGRRYEHGVIYSGTSIGTHDIHGVICHAFDGQGGSNGQLGLPTSGETLTPDHKGHYQHFQHGLIFSVPGAGTHDVHGSVWQLYANIGGPSSNLGYPIASLIATSNSRGKFQKFQHGGIYVRTGLGTHEVHGALYTAYNTRGGPTGSLGFPVSSVYTSGSKRRSDFENGSLVYDPATGQVIRIP
jgi:uncharacterized protein with LGFP repeats